jgi:hypothetical protein
MMRLCWSWMGLRMLALVAGLVGAHVVLAPLQGIGWQFGYGVCVRRDACPIADRVGVPALRAAVTLVWRRGRPCRVAVLDTLPWTKLSRTLTSWMIHGGDRRRRSYMTRNTDKARKMSPDLHGN